VGGGGGGGGERDGRKMEEWRQREVKESTCRSSIPYTTLVAYSCPPPPQTGMHPILVDRKGKHVHKDIGCEKVSSLNDLVDIAQKIRDEKIKTVVESK
jgi:hypothetical protein